MLFYFVCDQGQIVNESLNSVQLGYCILSWLNSSLWMLAHQLKTSLKSLPCVRLEPSTFGLPTKYYQKVCHVQDSNPRPSVYQQNSIKKFVMPKTRTYDLLFTVPDTSCAWQFWFYPVIMFSLQLYFVYGSIYFPILLHWTVPKTINWYRKVFTMFFFTWSKRVCNCASLLL